MPPTEGTQAIKCHKGGGIRGEGHRDRGQSALDPREQPSAPGVTQQFRGDESVRRFTDDLDLDRIKMIRHKMHDIGGGSMMTRAGDGCPLRVHPPETGTATRVSM